MLKLKEGFVEHACGYMFHERGGAWVFEYTTITRVYFPAGGNFTKGSVAEQYEDIPLNGRDWREVAHEAYVAAGVDSPWEEID